MRRHPDRWHPKRIKPKVQFSKDIASMMIHSSKEHLKGKNDIAILHNKFFNSDTPNNRRQFRSQEYSQKEQSKQHYDVTINSRISSRFWSRLWPRSYITLARELIYILQVHSECKSSTNQVQKDFKDPLHRNLLQCKPMLASRWSFPGTLTMPYALRVCLQLEDASTSRQMTS